LSDLALKLAQPRPSWAGMMQCSSGRLVRLRSVSRQRVREFTRVDRDRLQRAGPTVTQGDEDDGCDASVSQERQTFQEFLVGLNRVGAWRLDILDPAQGERMCKREGLAMGA